ncbi:NADPH-dependent FMN reductase [Lacticaseibacillus brantae]|uniref:Oxidoreductase n=1 Tax=Lacticaseibacillus brantae DSM 23927 TaxID=1423727 RepID=A0A0R2AZH6_9LACO|nr:NADPH-dependent FMN reductase [Lacticaseibacillus brantae]KRM72197.1 oxidoreductase [Lacticaseibacillus brantae DSM 23927]
MYKLVGIVGNNWSGSRNRLLLQYMQTRYANQFELNLLETGTLPMYSQDDENNPTPAVVAFRAAIAEADGVIIATAEHNHSVPTALKNALDWCSRVEHPMVGKPVMIVGASLGPMGTVRAQGHLRQILDSPGIGAHILPGNEFLITDSSHQFDETGQLNQPATIAFLDQSVTAFADFLGHEIP